MASVVPLRRDMAAILQDIETSRVRMLQLAGATRDREPDEDEDRLWGRLEARIDVGIAEARALVRAAFPDVSVQVLCEVLS